MKKQYIKPELATFCLQSTTFIAESLYVNSDSDEGGSQSLVKGDNTSRQNYNVWDDDWSN